MMGVEQLAGSFGQRVCFECSPDNRSILSRAAKGEIEAAVDQLVAGFSSEAGGLILIAAPDNFDCVSVEAQQMAMAAVRRAVVSWTEGYRPSSSTTGWTCSTQILRV